MLSFKKIYGKYDEDNVKDSEDPDDEDGEYGEKMNLTIIQRGKKPTEFSQATKLIFKYWLSRSRKYKKVLRLASGVI